MRLRLINSVFWAICFLSAYPQSNDIKVRIIDGSKSKNLQKQIEKNASALLADLNVSFKNDTEKIFFYSEYGISGKAKESINAIWETSKFYCTKQNIDERLLETDFGYELRNIPVLLDSLKEEIVLEFDKKGTVSDIYFAVNQHQYKNIAPSNVVVDETKKNIIRDFLESLKTAYIKKDLNFINTVLSDKALIVVGKTIKPTDKQSFKITDTGKQTLYNDTENSTYKKMTKAEYIDGLKRIFRSNKNILVHYRDIEIIPHRKSGYESFCGVRLKQKWQTDNYKDDGILFFVIQFRENDYPLIWVRVWQDANTTSPSEQIGMGEILINPN